MDYKEFLKNWGKEKKTTMAVACGACSMPIEDEYQVCAIPGIGMVCMKCYRDINLQAMIFRHLAEKE